MAHRDKKYSAAIKAGVIGVVLIIIVWLFISYMYQRDQYNYWQSDAPQHMDNFCVGVVWLPVLLIFLAIIAAAIGGLSVRMAGSTVASPIDAVRVSAVASLVTWGINVALLASSGSIFRAIYHTGGSLAGDLASLINYASWLLVYLLAQTFISVLGGIEEAHRKLKK